MKENKEPIVNSTENDELTNYQTEMTRSILKSKNARRILGWIPPVYGEAYVFLHLLQKIGEVLDKAETWSEEVQAQVVPQTATWSLPYWEERYGVIPENPESKIPEDIQKRRDVVIAKRRTRYPMNKIRIQQYVKETTGLEIEIVENLDKNQFKVIARAPEEQVAKIRKALDRVKPAHLSYKIETMNWHLTLAEFTHMQLGKYSQQQLREEKLENLVVLSDYTYEELESRTYTDVGTIRI